MIGSVNMPYGVRSGMRVGGFSGQAPQPDIAQESRG